MYSTLKNAVTVNGKKQLMTVMTKSDLFSNDENYVVFLFSGADRLFCGPMFVPVLILLPY